MPRKGVKLEIVNFRRILLLLLVLVLVQLAYLTNNSTDKINMKLGRGMKLCDLTNNTNSFLGKKNTHLQVIRYKGDMYVHVLN